MRFVDAVRTAVITGLGIAVGEVMGKSGLHGRTFAKNVPKIRKEAARKARAHGANTAESIDVADSCVIEVYTKLENDPHAFDGPASPGTVIRTMATHEFIDRLRAGTSRTEREIAVGERMLALIYSHMTTDGRLDERELRAAREAGLARLTPELRAVIDLQAVDVPDRQKAKRLGVSLATVKRRLQAGRTIMAEALTAAGFPIPGGRPAGKRGAGGRHTVRRGAEDESDDS
jgi:RNA polymerase sigma factor (sigma-70 family)